MDSNMRQELKPRVNSAARQRARSEAALARAEKRILAEFRNLDGAGTLPAGSAPGVLSPRETEILRLLADGLNTHQMARRLLLSAVTVQKHRSRIFRKLGARNAPHAVALAFRRGLVE